MTDQPDTPARILAAVEAALGDQLTTTARTQALNHIRSILTEQAATAEAELAALRQVARGYCPHCGRGDCAPTAEDWERQRDRAQRAEAERDELRDEITATVARLADMAKSRADQDGAELVRLRARVVELEARDIRAALDQPKENQP